MKSEDACFHYRMQIEEDGKGYHVSFPAFKGVHAGGRTKDEAINHAHDALEIYFLSIAKHTKTTVRSFTIEPEEG